MGRQLASSHRIAPIRVQATFPGHVAVPNQPSGTGPKHHRFRRYGLPILAIVVLIGALVAIKASQIATLIHFGRAAQAAGPPPEVVATGPVQTDTWHRVLFSIGSVEPSVGVAVSNEVPGTVSKIRFTSGAHVNQGDVLVELDTSVEDAQLRAAIARRDLASVNARRSRELFESKAIPQAIADADTATFAASTADANALAAQVAKKVVRAPFAGRIGIREVNVGQYLSPGTRVATLQSSDDRFVDFTLPQDQLSDLKIGTKVDIALRQSNAKPIAGELAAIDPTVDETSRSIKLRATSKDPDKHLHPGMFVGVSVVFPEEEHVVIVPTTAVVHAPYGDSVYVVAAGPKGGQIAQQKFIRTGETRGDFVRVTDGLSGEETVVTSGAFKLHNGAAIKVDNEVAPHPELAPHPVNR